MIDPLRHAKSNLIAAEQAYVAMSQSTTFEEYESEWRDFLTHLEKVWIKTERACVHLQPKFQPWQGKYLALRRKDMLLRYLKAARDADNHSIQDLAIIKDGSTSVNFAKDEGVRSCVITFKDGEMVIESDDPLVITNTPPHPAALPVKNHGDWYNPPTSHIGQMLTNRHPTEFALLGLNFYKNFVNDVENTFFTKL
ncbi:hypothetical protein [Pseudomonas sp. WS 5027]|uniref:hypothetical protein n=1 Tax=Pseudomonas sp. WS 5027 TaxID=2717483 RepID=UPI001472A0D5|nr:hypothetical protein [Pseudomonas sp. WS 5027]NMY45301.1 hypothetical protein [Pseudomonas sp. WS 5027]